MAEGCFPEPLVPLEELYSCALSGSCPSLTPVQSGRLLRSCLCAQTAGESALESRCESDSALELRFVSLTVLEVLLSRLTARSGTPQFRVFAEETVSLLQSDVLHALLQQFHSEDQLLSHLTVKCVSAAVLYQLHNNDVVSPEWSETCIQAFSSSCPSRLLDSCVHSLTEVLRQLLKGAHQELMQKVLNVFDHSLSGSGSQCLRVDRGEDSLCLLLDLLELLCASRSMCGDSVSVPCLVCVHASELLAVCSCPLLRAAVRRRGLLLMKRVLVQRVAEDWCNQRLGCSDLKMLTQSVLQAAAQGWMKGVQVEGAVFFGGTRTVPSTIGMNVDNISVRAVCLILLKSMELQCQSDVQELPLQCLWDVLKRCGLFTGPPSVDPPVLPSGSLPHRCSWLSAVFADQDDDMMEAAKALLSIYLHHRQHHSSLTPDQLQLWACSSGSNPHCHFLLLLRGLAFDHRVLLDFLISTETCFLEYCVRYFRFLRTDPEDFRAACSQSGAAGVGKEVPLVDYPSSGESDTEEMETGQQYLDIDSTNCTIVCLCELREVVSRLHSKKLFPYNPTSLIKLLTEVEASLRSVCTK